MSSVDPNLGLVHTFGLGFSTWNAEMDTNLKLLGAIVQVSVIDRNLTAPPGGESAGDRYIPASLATGAWAGREDDIALWDGSSWVFYTPKKGWRCYVEDEDLNIVWDASTWDVPSDVQTNSTHSALVAGNPHVVTQEDAAAGGGEEVVITSSNRTVTTETIVVMNTTVAGRDVVLPDAAAAGVRGKKFTVVKESSDTNNVTVKTAGGLIETVAGGTGVTIGGSGRESGTWVSDGTDYWKVSAG